MYPASSSSKANSYAPLIRGSQIRGSQTNSMPSSNSVTTYTPHFQLLDAPSQEQCFDFYLETLCQRAESKLGINDHDPKNKNANQFHKILRDDLQKRNEKKLTQAHSTLAQIILPQSKQRRLNALTTAAGLTITVGIAVNASVGIGLATATTMLYIGYIVAEIYKARKNQQLAKVLQDYLLPKESKILDLVSLLTTLLVKDELDTALRIRHNTRLQCDFQKLINFAKKLFDHPGDEDSTVEWTKEERVVTKSAQKYAKKIFKNLENYAKNKKSAKEIDRKILDTLIPKFVYEDQGSTKITQDRVALTAWLSALSMLVKEVPTHIQELYNEGINVLRITTDNIMMENKRVDDDNASTFSETMRLSYEETSNYEETSKWLEQCDFKNAPSSVSLFTASPVESHHSARLLHASDNTPRANHKSLAAKSSPTSLASSGSSVHLRQNSIRSSHKNDTVCCSHYTPLVVTSSPTSLASSGSSVHLRQNSIRSSHKNDTVRCSHYTPLVVKSSSTSLASSSSFVHLRQNSIRSLVDNEPKPRSIYTSLRPHSESSATFFSRSAATVTSVASQQSSSTPFRSRTTSV